MSESSARSSGVVIVGAGAVGLTLGGRLAASGERVIFVVRRREVARAIESQGVRVHDVATGERIEASAEAVARARDAAEVLRAFPVVSVGTNG